MSVAVRFAPSPTGPLHIGGVRTALYNYLFARKHGGRCILRIEDTDQTRYVPGAEEFIMEALAWMGISFDEGVREGGAFGPYRQSDRAAQGMYRQYADQLLTSGHAYMAFDTTEALDAMRERLKTEGGDVQQYNAVTRGSMRNSLSLPPDEVEALLAAGVPYVVRMKMPDNEDIVFQDVVRGEVSFNSRQLDDKVLLKSDGMPTYHLANVVDDRLMQITHVIRGEEWLSSTPLHVKLYEALGWRDTMPQFVHLPLILNPNGQGKMSKRQGDKLGFSVFPIAWTDPETGAYASGYREDGYLPDALMNFLALLGWHPGGDEEIMDVARLIESFSLERIHSAGTKFDLDKLRWFNQTYIRAYAPADLLPALRAEVAAAGHGTREDAFLLGVIVQMQERATFVRDMVQQAPYYFVAPTEYDAQMVAKRWKAGESTELMRALQARFAALERWEAAELEAAFNQLLADTGAGTGKVLAPLRLVLTGMAAGPGVFDIAALIGREETLARIDRAVGQLG
ncbi:MAG: glutamate--tRNA ligase [Bacteroidia bacterium]